MGAGCVDLCDGFPRISEDDALEAQSLHVLDCFADFCLINTRAEVVVDCCAEDVVHDRVLRGTKQGRL